MSDPVWYYAHGDSEKGPLTTAQIKALAAAGKIKRDDFVWKEGMASWAPAREVGELFKGEKPTSAELQVNKNRPKPAAGEEPRHDRPKSHGTAIRPMGFPTVLVGLVTVVLAHGCDSLGDRYVERLRAISADAPRQFQQQWDQDKSRLQQQFEALSDQPPPAPSERDQLSRQMAELDSDRRSRMQDLQNGPWLELRVAAQDADNQHARRGFWLEASFIAGTLVLVTGLLLVAFSSSGPDRWICLALLAAIVGSIYVNRSIADSNWPDF